MARKKQKKKKGFFGKFFSLIGWLLLLALILAAIFVFVINERLKSEEVTADSIDAYLEAESGDFASHYIFSPDYTLEVVLDKSDVWYYLSNELEDGWFESINRTLSSFDAELRSVGLNLERQLSVDAELYIKDIRVPVTLECSVETDGNTVKVTADTVKILWFEWSVTEIEELIHTEINACMEFEPELTFLKSIESVSTLDGCVILSGQLSPDFLQQDFLSELKLSFMKLCMDDYAVVGRLMKAYTEDPETCLESVIEGICADAGEFEKIYDRCLCLNAYSSEQLAGKNYGMLKRWMKSYRGLDEYIIEYTEFIGNTDLVLRCLQGMSSIVCENYAGKKITIKERYLQYNKKDLTFANLFGDSYITYANLLNLGSARFCFYKGDDIADDVKNMKFPKISEIMDSTESLSETVDSNTVFALALMIEGDDGGGYLIIFNRAGDFKIQQLESAEFLRFIDYKTIPVFNRLSTAEGDAA